MAKVSEFSLHPPAEKELRYTNQLQYFLRYVICPLIDHKDAWAFMEPLNPSRNASIRTHFVPMGLRTIKKRLQYHFYTSVNEAIDDISVMFENVYKLTKPGQLLFGMANELENCYREKMQSMPKTEIVIEIKNYKNKNSKNTKHSNAEKSASSVRTATPTSIEIKDEPIDVHSYPTNLELALNHLDIMERNIHAMGMTFQQQIENLRQSIQQCNDRKDSDGTDVDHSEVIISVDTSSGTGTETSNRRSF